MHTLSETAPGGAEKDDTLFKHNYVFICTLVDERFNPRIMFSHYALLCLVFWNVSFLISSVLLLPGVFSEYDD